MARLILSCIFLLLSLLCVFPAPAIQLWYVAILVTEFPWIFIFAAALILLWGFAVSRYALPGTVVSVVALLLFVSPVIGAYRIGSTLNNNFENAFGRGSAALNYTSSNKPFSLLHMFSGLNAPQLPYNTLAYSSCAEGQLTLDLYHAQMIGKRPCLIVVHGGSWTSGDSRQLPELNTYLARVGYHVATINYRMVPQHKSPAPVEDVRATISYLKSHAEELDIDTNNFVLLGRSAGGQIVLAAAYTLQDPGIKGVIDIYGPADMAWGYAHPANPLVLNSCKLMDDYLGGTPAQVPQQYAVASGTAMATSHSVPTLMIHGKNDPLVAYEHSIRLGSKLQELGVPYLLLSMPWATHGCDYSLNGPAGQLSAYTIERFMAHVTQK